MGLCTKGQFRGVRLVCDAGSVVNYERSAKASWSRDILPVADGDAGWYPRPGDRSRTANQQNYLTLDNHCGWSGMVGLG